MSAIMNFAIFPMDKGDHVGEYVSRVVQLIKESGFEYQFSPMSTIVEADSVADLTDLINRAYEVLSPVSERVYCNVSIDYSVTKSNRMEGKRHSIEKRIGKLD